MFRVVIRRKPSAWRELEFVARYTPKLTFSKIELEQMFISMLVLIVASAFAFSDVLMYGFYIDRFAFLLMVSAIAVGTGFLLHELAHKLCAQKYGYWAEYRYFPLGLAIALFFSLLGLVFAAPGAVVIRGIIDRNAHCKISAAGPATNLTIALCMIPILLFFKLPLVSVIAFLTAKINVFLGGFNLIPFPPLDGAKVFASNKKIFAVLIAITIATFVAVFGWLPKILL